MVNDLPVGRNIDELVRLVDALQFADKHGEVRPAGSRVAQLSSQMLRVFLNINWHAEQLNITKNSIGNKLTTANTAMEFIANTIIMQQLLNDSVTYAIVLN